MHVAVKTEGSNSALRYTIVQPTNQPTNKFQRTLSTYCMDRWTDKT